MEQHDDDGPWHSAGPLWRVSFEAMRELGLDCLDRLEGMGLTLAAHEIDEGDEVEGVPPRWGGEILLEAPPAPDLEAKVREALAQLGIEILNWKCEDLPPRDWLAAVAASHKPMAIGRFFVHGPDHAAEVPGRLIGIEVEAGLAFGSGEHESTEGCLLALDRLLRGRDFSHVLDMGCGSGILAIAAARTTRAKVLAIDNDPVAVEVTAANAVKNKVGTRIEAAVSEGFALPLIHRRAPFDLIFANILADPLRAMAPQLRRHLAPGGIAILAGLLDRQADAVEEAYARTGVMPWQRIPRGRWTTLLLRRPRRGRRLPRGRNLAVALAGGGLGRQG